MSAPDIELIAGRVRRSAPAEREQLLEALDGLAERLDGSPRAQALVGEILAGLAADAEPELRRKLARWAADGRCTPPELAAELSRDPIEVAAPVITRSPMLTEADLLALVAELGPEHQIAVGRRKALLASVIEAVLEQGEPAALAALAGNTSAPLAPEHLDRLVGMAARLPALRAPLARRRDLAPELRTALLAAPGRPEGWERRLVGKLAAAGRLTPGYALRLLREGHLAVFEHAVAALAGLPLKDVRAATAADGAQPLMEACLAAGLDRSVLPLVLAEVRELTGGRPGDLPPVRKARPRRASSGTAAKPTGARRKPAAKRART